ncbi:hypothetical protein OPT61_g3873 [Boeremia exigua]|uniref:Uncharacterized protein n=1 Tax=Boeremia exigua TaxID=749465 RepID=A0ACC2IGD3_9PLEO|nr:hypothetical protein OPT61_g3873 [Boeremia exigua]
MHVQAHDWRGERGSTRLDRRPGSSRADLFVDFLEIDLSTSTKFATHRHAEGYGTRGFCTRAERSRVRDAVGLATEPDAQGNLHPTWATPSLGGLPGFSVASGVMATIWYERARWLLSSCLHLRSSPSIGLERLPQHPTGPFRAQGHWVVVIYFLEHWRSGDPLWKMLGPLTSKRGHSERSHSNTQHVSRTQASSIAHPSKMTRSSSTDTCSTREFESMNLRHLPARAGALTSNPPTATMTDHTVTRSTPRTQPRSLSIYTSVPSAGSVASSRASRPGSSGSSKLECYNVPHLTKTPWEVERYKKNSTWRRSGPEKEFPVRVFKNLPREVYDCIVAQLEEIHLQQEQACPSCYLKDLHSLSLTNRNWDRAATLQMYGQVYVIGHEDHLQSPKAKFRGPGRLKLLRRTLRERPLLARRVRELHLADLQTLYQQASIEREEIVNLVASLVMACPSLERLVGFHVPFTRNFDRLSYALATRSKLRERVWLLSEPEDDYSDGEDDDKFNNYYLAARDPIEHFLNLNSGHSLLTTLVLHSTPCEYTPALNFRAIIGTFRQLPMLQHLSISNLPATSFTSLALNALPPRLRSLRLENLPGINDKGLQKFITSHLSTSIEKLTLINLELSSLITVTNILSEHLSRLQRFTLAQYRTPDLGSRISIPNLSCSSLQFLHVEFRSQASPAIDPFSAKSRKSMEFPFRNSEPISCLATSLLATNIREGAFPALRKVRVPYDPQGLIQAVCRPRATALLPSDTSLFTHPMQKSGPHGYAIMVDTHVSKTQSPGIRESSHIVPLSPRADSAIDSPTLDTSPSSSALSPSKARLAAQARILAARKVPLVTVRVQDPEGVVRIDTGIGGFIGDIKSNVSYDLRPDASRWPGSRDQSGPPQPEWTTGIEDLVDERTAPDDRAREWHWGSCGHRIGGRRGRNTVQVCELF